MLPMRGVGISAMLNVASIPSSVQRIWVQVGILTIYVKFHIN